MKHIKKPVASFATLLVLAAAVAHAEPRRLNLTVQTRDPKTGAVIVKTEEVDSDKVAVVIVDPWNFHWCMTACERVSAMVPRWNRAVECARKLGMPILWAPSDVVCMYSGFPQRERAMAVPLVPVPKLRDLPPAQFTSPIGTCMCGPGISCVVNYGWDGMNPGLVLGDDDLIASTTEEVYSLLKQRGITHVIYLGLHTNMCLFGKPGALKYMVQAGLNCMVARDINDAFTSYDPAAGFTPDKGTQQTDEDLERAGVSTINIVGEWRKAGVWDDNWIVETVRITPWGKPNRPYFFEQSVTVTLTTPWLTDVEIRYTLDGSAPSASSPLYEKPLNLKETKSLRTAAFRAGKLVSVPTDARFAHLPPMPPKPELTLDHLVPVKDPYLYQALYLWQPRTNESYEAKPLRIRGKNYVNGLGMRAPTYARYPLKPEWSRFVALAGIDDNLIDQNNGADIAQYPSVVFRVFIDGQLQAESPVMRISQEPWRFDVKIPQGSRFINLVCMDAGSRSPYDLGNWVDAGFVLEQKP